MDLKKLAKSATPKRLAAYLAGLPDLMQYGHGRKGPSETVRQEEHNGHRIVIRTIYDVQVDGTRVQLPLSVDNKGQVHCHSLPNYEFASAVDMIKTLIDNFPEDFALKKKPVKRLGAHSRHAKLKHRKGRK
jgi:hypothetical protein